MLSCWCQSEFRNLACDSRLRLTSVNLFEKGLEVYRAPTPGSSKRWQQQRFWISIDHWSLTLKKQHLPTEGANKFQIQSLLKFQLQWQALDWILDHGTQAHKCSVETNICQHGLQWIRGTRCRVRFACRYFEIQFRSKLLQRKEMTSIIERNIEKQEAMKS